MENALRPDANSVSVVIPAYRAAAFLTDAVASVRAQTVPPLEIIVVDDCSTDNTVAVANSLGVIVLESDTNGGAARARNIGIQRARGEWIAFLDADDRWHPEHLELSLFALRETGAILSSTRTLVGEEFPSLSKPVAHQVYAGWELMAHLLGPNPVAQTTCTVRRDVLQRVGAYRDGERYCEDYELWLRLGTEGSFVHVDAITCLYRLHEGQTSRASVQMFSKAWEHRLSAYRQWLKKHELDVTGLHSKFDTALARALSVDLTAVWYSVDTASRDYFKTLAETTPEISEYWKREVAGRDSWIVARLRRFARRIVRSKL